MIDNTLESYKNWSKVSDYESDENTVTLLDKKGNKLIEFNYPKFTKDDFDYFKNITTKKQENE